MKKAIFGGIAVAALAVPAFALLAPKSGLNPGESISPFHPKHLSGPLAGTDKCFPCTYQSRPQVMVWVNGDDAKNVDAITTFLQKEISANKAKEFKALVVVLGDEKSAAPYVSWAKSTKSKDVAIALLPKTDEAIKNYKINTGADIKNTVLVYKDWKVSANMNNLKAADLPKLDAAIDKITK